MFLNYSNLNPDPLQESFKLQIRRDPKAQVLPTPRQIPQVPGGWRRRTNRDKGTGANYERRGGKTILHFKFISRSSKQQCLPGCILVGKAQYLRAERKQLPSEILANSDFCNIKEPGTCLSLKQ